MYEGGPVTSEPSLTHVPSWKTYRSEGKTTQNINLMENQGGLCDTSLQNKHKLQGGLQAKDVGYQQQR